MKLKDIFVPHSDNDHKPHILREIGIVVVVLFVGINVIFSLVHSLVLVRSSEFLAAVLPKVLVDLTNEDRSTNGLSGLTVNPLLVDAAQMKADHMAEHGYFAHNSPDGLTPWHWIIQSGYQFMQAGENLAVNFSDSGDVVQAWMESPGHRENILNGGFTEIGIATAKGTYKGEETVFVVQMFGTPSRTSRQLAVAPPIPEDVPPPTPATDVEPIPEVRSENEVLVEEMPIEVEIIEETDTFLAVTVPNDVSEIEDFGGEEELAGAEAEGLVPQASFFERLVSQPHQILQWIYIILGALILLVLTATIVIEIEKQHPKNVIYGIVLLILLVVLGYINRMALFSDLLII